MKRFLALLLCVCVLLTASPVAFANDKQTDAQSEYVANEVLIMQKDRSAKPLPLKSAEVIDCSALSDCADEEINIIKGTVDYGTDIEKMCEKLEKRSDIISADPNYISTLAEISVPEEARRTGYEYNAYNWYKNSLSLVEAWQGADTLGSDDVVVGVIDTGVNENHLDIKDNMWSDDENHHGYNGINDTYDISDTNSHGSNVAGIIGMESNAFGYAGISPKVKIMGLKAASSTSFTDSAILKCLNFALENGADIINMSYTGSNLSDTMAYSYQSAARKAVLVAAAGNSSLDCAENPQYPAACAGVIGVMAYGSYGNTDRTNYNIDNSTLSDFSNYDQTGLYYQIAAPGIDIEGVSNKSNDEFTLKSGTSQATPIVAGTAALYLSLYPDANSYQVRQAIINSAEKQIDGYYDEGTYKKINISAALSSAPCEDEPLNLSEGARRIMSSAFGEDISNPRASDLDSLGFITASDIENKSDLSAIVELNGVQNLSLKNLDLSDSDVSFLANADFYRLAKLDLSSNPALENIAFSDKMPVLRQLDVSSCSLSKCECFIPLQGLNELIANDNLFISTAALKEMPGLKSLEMENCALQDCIGLKQPNKIVSADISGNYISDASPLLNYNGAYLDISSNPLSLSDNKNYCLKSIKDFMNDNYYSYNSIKFLCSALNGDSEKEYIKAKSIALEQKEVPRCDENAVLKTVTSPANANVNSYAILGCRDTRVKLNSYTGAIAWHAEDFKESETLKIDISPTSAFPNFTSALKIAAPEVLEFSYKNGSYNLKTNKATNFLKIGDVEIYSYAEEGSVRSFQVPKSVIYSENLVAVPHDSIGAGNEFRINTAKNDTEGKSGILEFYSDKQIYSTFERANVYILTNNSTNEVKIKDCVNKTEFILSVFEQTERGRLFNFKTDITSARDRKYKAYSSADGSFSMGAKVLTFTAKQAPANLKLSLGDRPALYFTENYDSTDIEAAFYPASCKEKIEYISSNPEAVTVDEHGKLKAERYGSSIIEATSESGLKYSLPVVVITPEMTDVDTTVAKAGEVSTFEFYTYAASDVVIKNKDGSDVNFNYSVEKTDSNMDGFDAHYKISATINDSLEHNIKIYAVDENGVNAYTHFKDVKILCPSRVEDFEIISEKDCYNRNDGAITLTTGFTPASSRGQVRWSLSSSTVATLKGYSDRAVLTPKGSGSVTVYATCDGISKEKTISFYGGRIMSAEANKSSAEVFEQVNISVKTSKDVKYIYLYDSDNSIGQEYKNSYYYTVLGDYKYWSLPYYYIGNSDTLEISCGDNIGACEDKIVLSIQARCPQEDKLATNPPFILGETGGDDYIEAMMTTSLSPVEAEFTSENENIATVEDGYITLCGAGETNIICNSEGEELRVPVKVFAPIKKITLSQSTYSLTAGQETPISAETQPENPTDSINFRSDNTDVFEVEDGKIIAKGAGNATLIAESNGGIKATAEVKVKSAEQINNMHFENDNYYLEVGESLAPTLITDITDYTNQVKFYSSNKRILDFESDTFTALQTGTVTITAESDSGVKCTAEVEISAEKQLMLSRNYVSVSLHSLTDISIVCLPEGIDDDGFWFSDNKQVAVVGDGIVYAKSKGYCNIYYVSDSGEVESCVLKVNSVNIRSFSLAESTAQLEVGENYFIGYSQNPTYTDEILKFTSLNEEVAKVDENGIVNAISEGNALIYISAENGRSYTMSITVTASKYSLGGYAECEAEAKLIDICSGERTIEVDGEFEIENLPHSTYSLTLSAPHHTSVTVEDIDLCENANVGDIYLPDGDVNADGIIDISDISTLLQIDVFAKTAVNENYDINGDDFINISDISIILLAGNYGEENRTIVY